jgi:hypothetical protein
MEQKPAMNLALLLDVREKNRPRLDLGSGCRGQCDGSAAQTTAARWFSRLAGLRDY